MDGENKTMTVLEVEGCDYRLYKNWYKAQHDMLKEWFEGYGKDNLNEAIERLEKISKGSNESYDLGEAKHLIMTVKDDLVEALYEGYIESFAWTYSAEVMD